MLVMVVDCLEQVGHGSQLGRAHGFNGESMGLLIV